MKLVIDATAAMSGGKVYLDSLLIQFARQTAGDEFIIFHTGDFDELSLPESQSRFEFQSIKLPLSLTSSWAGSSILKMFWRLVVLPVHLRRIKPDMVFLNGGFGPAWKGSTMKSVLVLHNSMPLRDELIAAERSLLRRWRLVMLRRLIRRSFHQSDRSIVFSHDTKQRVLKCFGVLKHDPSIIYHGIDWGERERATPVNFDELQRLGVSAPYLLYVSQFHRYKNVIGLLEAFATVSVRHPDLRLVLVGEAADRGYWQEIEQVMARLGIAERVTYIPACRRERLISIYSGALAFVHPSLAETCSFPLLEALALGLPIAAASLSALPEMAGDSAVYFDPYDPQDMAAVLDRLVCDETLRNELSLKAKRRAAAFSWAKTAGQTLQLMREAVES
jgi:glycosyltransferase involved in cell wall biosynthesis